MTAANKSMAEEATGIYENSSGIGTLYADQGNRIIKPGKELRTELDLGLPVEAPNAGAGSYYEFFVTLAGYKDLKVFDQSSSAGDWSMAVFNGDNCNGDNCNGDNWLLAFQNNRYPRHGFKYSVDNFRTFSTFEQLCQSLL